MYNCRVGGDCEEMMTSKRSASHIRHSTSWAATARLLLAVSVLPLAWPRTAHAQAAPATQATTQPDARVVGTVYGKAITAKDIGLTKPINVATPFDARDTEQWQLMMRISSTFGRPVTDHFTASHDIKATPEEIEAFRRNLRKSMAEQLHDMMAKMSEIKAKLEVGALSDEEKARQKKRLEMYEKILPVQRAMLEEEIPEATARPTIVAWKVQQALYRTYGGRVIFQQAGPEAIDALKALYEGAEKSGDLHFDDAGVRHLFYYYFTNVKFTAIKPDVLDHPWFLKKADDPHDTRKGK